MPVSMADDGWVLRFYPDGVELSVDMRFPLFGGWKTVFYQGYNVPIQVRRGPGEGVGARRGP